MPEDEISSGPDGPATEPGERRDLQLPKFDGYFLSGWWRRAAARTLDAVLVVLLLFAIELALGFKPSQLIGHNARHLSTLRHTERVIAGLLLIAAYYPLIMWKTEGRTLGKLALGIQVIRADHQPMSLSRAAWREVVLGWGVFSLIDVVPAIGSTMGLVLALADWLWPVFDRQHRALHDIAAATRVVHAPRSWSKASA